MKDLTPEAKAVLRLIANHVEEAPLHGKLTIWRGVSHLTPEDTEAGLLARHNAQIIEEALKRQEDFLAILEPKPKGEPSADGQ